MNISPRTIEKLDKIGHKYRCQLCLPPFYGKFNLFYDARKKKGEASKLCQEVKQLGFKTKTHYCWNDWGLDVVQFIELKKR